MILIEANSVGNLSDIKRDDLNTTTELEWKAILYRGSHSSAILLYSSSKAGHSRGVFRVKSIL
jgi:hypothetical protein